jgi:SAM-dependent methyltransferase
MIRTYLPNSLNDFLFGKRRLYGQQPDLLDPDWQQWQKCYADVYFDTQKAGATARLINNKGYEILADFDFEGVSVAEIGPGGGYHFPFIKGRMQRYTALDVNETFLTEIRDPAESICREFTAKKVNASEARLDLPNSSCDMFLAFYSLEHLHPLESWLKEIFRVLKPGGRLIGAIPTEGGVLWGMGRALTSRQIIMKKYGIDLGKIVCWEHPNFCDDITRALTSFGEARVTNWPLRGVPADFNLLQKFVVSKRQ